MPKSARTPAASERLPSKSPSKSRATGGGASKRPTASKSAPKPVTRPRQIRKSGRLKRRPVWGIALAVIVAVICGGFALVWGAIDHAAVIDDAVPGDAVVVLGCAVYPNGEPSPALRARIDEGVRVWRATGSRFLLVTGGVGAHPPAEAVVMHRIALQQGVPASAIIDDTSAHTTEDSALACARIVRRLGWKRVILVSDPWHMLRARQLFVDYAKGTGLDVRQSPAFLSPAWTYTGVRARYTLRECLGVSVYWVKRAFR